MILLAIEICYEKMLINETWYNCYLCNAWSFWNVMFKNYYSYMAGICTNLSVSNVLTMVVKVQPEWYFQISFDSKYLMQLSHVWGLLLPPNVSLLFSTFLLYSLWQHHWFNWMEPDNPQHRSQGVTDVLHLTLQKPLKSQDIFQYIKIQIVQDFV